MSPTRSWETGEESAAARSQEQLLEPDLAQQSLVPKQILILRKPSPGRSEADILAEADRA